MVQKMTLMQDRHGTFYLRIILTNELRKRLGITNGQGEYRRSLGTKSKREAAKRLPEAYVHAVSSHSPTATSNRPRATPNKLVQRQRKHCLSKLLVSHIKLQELTGVLPKTLNSRQHSISLLLECIGDKPVDLYTKADARKFRDTLANTPKKGRTGKKIAVSTLNVYLSRVQAFFNWLEDEGYVTTNVFRNIKVKVAVKRLQSSYRDAFSSKDLTNISNALTDTRIDRRLVTYICLFSGCRISEAVQLSKDDIYQVDGCWCIHIRQEKPYQRLKNQSSERVIPVHSELIRIGLVEHCASVEDRLFPNAKSAAISQWFRKVLESLEIGPKKTFHSFRHTVANTMKQNGVDVSLAAALLGHSTGTMTYDRYGKTLNPEALVDIVELIKLEGETL